MNMEKLALLATLLVATTSMAGWMSYSGSTSMLSTVDTFTSPMLYVGYEASGVSIQTGGHLEVERLRLAQSVAAAKRCYSISSGSTLMVAEESINTTYNGQVDMHGVLSWIPAAPLMGCSAMSTASGGLRILS